MKISLLYKNAQYQQMINEGVFDPAIFKAVFLAGGPGSGKSFVAGNVTAGMGYKFISSDIAFEHLLTKMGTSHKLDQLSDAEFAEIQTTRNAAKDITNKIQKSHVDGRLGLIFDGTGHDYNKIQKLRNEIVKYGYDAVMIFVNTSLEVAMERNRARPRTIPDAVVEERWKSVQNNIGKFQNLFGSNFIVVDNNEYGDGSLLNSVWKRVNKFTKTPIRNPIAKKWIDRALQLRKRT